MFTGIIELEGQVEALREKPNLLVLEISVGKSFQGVKLGESIAVNGVCLTVTSVNHSQRSRRFYFDVMKETIEKTTLRYLRKGSRVNLERALRANDRLGGHFVSGHVDGVAKILKIITGENYAEFQIAMIPELARYFAPKGSVAVDGISLTVGKVSAKYFSIYLIPHTLNVTTFGEKKEGDWVNIETDLLAKYILRGK